VPPISHPTEFDVAVVGGGVSGAYAAWRLRDLGASSPKLAALAHARPDGRLKVGLFESSGRIGGRLFSIRVPGLPSIPIELGGMRFLTSHVRVAGLVNLLGLQTRPLLVQDPNGRCSVPNMGGISSASARSRCASVRSPASPSRWAAP
jgi:monoamine oxidase